MNLILAEDYQDYNARVKRILSSSPKASRAAGHPPPPSNPGSMAAPYVEQNFEFFVCETDKSHIRMGSFWALGWFEKRQLAL